MATYAAEAYLSDTKVGSNIFKGNSHKYIGCFAEQCFISLFCGMKLYAFDPVDSIYISSFKYFSKQSFNLRKTVVQFKKLVGIDGNNFCILQYLYRFTAWFACK